MKKINKVKIFKIILLIISIVIIADAMIYLIPVMKDISTPEGQIKFKEEMESLGIYGMLEIIALQFAQIFLIVLPR